MLIVSTVGGGAAALGLAKLAWAIRRALITRARVRRRLRAIAAPLS